MYKSSSTKIGRTCYWTGLIEPYKKNAGCSGGRKNHRSLPKQSWEYGVMGNARELGEKSWRNAARYKNGWRKLLKKPWAQTGLFCQ
jgi:hypothetical protein